MNSRASQSVHDGAGRINLTKNDGAIVPVNLTHLLPDGSRLTDDANAGLLNTILGIVETSRPRISNASFVSLIGSLHLLLQWMFLRAIYKFSSLRKHHFKEFLNDTGLGLDHCIDATGRLHAHLHTLKGMSTAQRKKLGVHDVFSQAHIPPTYAPRLPHLGKLVQNFAARGSKALPARTPEPRKKPLSQATRRGRGKSIQLLWTCRSSLPDPASMEPFTDIELATWIRAGAPKEQTRVAPASLAMKLLVGAMDAIMNVGPAALDWESTRRPGRGESSHDQQRFDHLNCLIAERWKLDLVLRPQGLKHACLTPVALMSNFMPLACQVAIYGYVGRRKVEVGSIESNCITGSETEGWHLSTYIAKRQTYESRPCPELVARAVDWMRRYQKYPDGHAAPLFVVRGKESRMRLDASLNRFASAVGAVDYVDTEGQHRHWHWHWHQFRRLFAVIYIWRYEDSSYLVLRHHLGHGSEREAAYYARLASDGNFADLADEAGLFTREKLQEVAKGRLVGAFAQVLSKRIERIRSKLRLTGEKSLSATISQLVEVEGLILNASPWGYCGCKATPSNMRRAKCRQGARSARPKHPIFNTPIPEDSEEETCSGCHFHATGPSREPHWRSVVLHLNRAIDGAPPDSLVAKLLKERRAKINAGVERFFGQQEGAPHGRK